MRFIRDAAFKGKDESLSYFFGSMAQLVRAPPCHGGGRGFESLLSRFVTL